jgi:hypothetical protein
MSKRNTRFENEHDVVFETEAPVMFSVLERKLGISMQWKPWKPRHFSVGSNATLIYRKDGKESPISGVLNIQKVSVTEMANHNDSEELSENGLIVTCNTMDGYDTCFRCILSHSDWRAFERIIREVSKDHNLDNMNRTSISEEVRASAIASNAAAAAAAKKAKDITSHSVMRRAVARAMDLYDVRSIQEKTVARRGAMKYLPVLFMNDLVHGSWYVRSTFFCFSLY